MQTKIKKMTKPGFLVISLVAINIFLPQPSIRHVVNIEIMMMNKGTKYFSAPLIQSAISKSS
jgi:hypothetical protein